MSKPAAPRSREPQYIIAPMPALWRFAARFALCLVLVAGAACSSPIGRFYEYEEQLYLDVDGSARVIVSASVPALVALRNLPLDAAPRARVDREAVRAAYESAGCQDVRVGQPWIRRGRHFVQIRFAVAHLDDLEACGPLAWSSYDLRPDGEVIQFEQTVGPPAGSRPPDVNWDGSEIVAFKLHVPSRISFHNVKRLEDGANASPGRGNILTWEQWLSDRLAGQPVEMAVTMGAESILKRTLLLFAGAFAAAVLVLVALVWFTVRRARRRPLAGSAR